MWLKRVSVSDSWCCKSVCVYGYESIDFFVFQCCGDLGPKSFIYFVFFFGEFDGLTGYGTEGLMCSVDFAARSSDFWRVVVGVDLGPSGAFPGLHS